MSENRAPTLYETLAMAATQNDLDAACVMVQDALGVTDGGVAGLVFSDMAETDDGSGRDVWHKLPLERRHRRLAEYVAAEMSHVPPLKAEDQRTTDKAVDVGDESAFRAFQSTRKEMTAKEFGDLVGDAQWEDDDQTRFLVYEDAWYIEVCADGRHLLTIENRGWMTGTDGTLEDLERELHAFSQIG